MKNNVINLKLHRMKLAVLKSLSCAQGVKNGDVSVSAYQSILDEDPHAFFGLENYQRNDKAAYYCGFLLSQDSAWEMLNNNLKTNNWQFKFPGILSHYARTLNPVIAYYNELQKVQLTLPKSNKRRKWVESILKDKKWKSAVVHALQQDIKSLSDYIEIWHREEFRISHVTLNRAIALKLRLMDCLKTFK